VKISRTRLIIIKNHASGWFFFGGVELVYF